MKHEVELGVKLAVKLAVKVGVKHAGEMWGGGNLWGLGGV